MKRVTLTDAQRSALVQVYLQQGYSAAATLAAEYGVKPRHVAKLLREREIPNTTKRGAKLGSSGSVNDPRWARAVAVGGVVA